MSNKANTTTVDSAAVKAELLKSLTPEEIAVVNAVNEHQMTLSDALSKCPSLIAKFAKPEVLAAIEQEAAQTQVPVQPQIVTADPVQAAILARLEKLEKGKKKGKKSSKRKDEDDDDDDEDDEEEEADFLVAVKDDFSWCRFGETTAAVVVGGGILAGAFWLIAKIAGGN